jgi:beta-phosphoglucomutase
MAMRQFDAVIFDLDGVLVNTAEFHYLGWKRLADELGIPFDRSINERLKGVSRLDSLKILLEKAPGREFDLVALADRKNGYYVEMIQGITPADLLPGVPELLEALRRLGVKVGVASASRNARFVLSRLEIEPWLDAVTDGNDFLKPKPAPDLFLCCAGRLEVPPGRCVVVEDAQAGIEAAHAGEMCAVGVGPPENLRGADVLIRSTGEFPLKLVGG